MTRNDIIRMAREVETVMTGHDYPHSDEFIKWCERFAALITAAEREACAQVCDDSATPRNDAYQASYILKNCAAAIRARSQE